MNYTILLIILGMAIVTYIPRMLPLVFMDTEKIPAWIQAILRNVPYAALGALIFPGIFTAHENIWFAVAGGVTAIVVAYLGANLIIVVLSSILVLSGLTIFFRITLFAQSPFLQGLGMELLTIKLASFTLSSAEEPTESSFPDAS